MILILAKLIFVLSLITISKLTMIIFNNDIIFQAKMTFMKMIS